MITRELLIEAAHTVDQSAEALRQQNTVDGEWLCFGKEELDAFETYQRERALADRLRLAAEGMVV